MTARWVLKILSLSFLQQYTPELRNPRTAFRVVLRMNPAARRLVKRSEEERDKLVAKFLDISEKTGIPEERVLAVARIMRAGTTFGDEVDRVIIGIATRALLGLDLSPMVSLNPTAPWFRLIGEVVCESVERGSARRSKKTT